MLRNEEFQTEPRQGLLGMRAEGTGGMRLVKWQDDADGGWHTGNVVTEPDGLPVTAKTPWFEGEIVLVRESCDLRLTWVPKARLEQWQMRDEWEAA